MRSLAQTAAALALIGLMVALMAGCGRSPPAGQVRSRVENAIRESRPDLVDGRGKAVEVASISVGGWEREGPKGPCRSTWTASLRFNEAHAAVVVVVDGTSVVRTVARAGDELAFTGIVIADANDDGTWETSAIASGEPWEKLARVGSGMSRGYRVFGNGDVADVFRSGAMYRPLSNLGPCVEEGTEEAARLVAAMAARTRAAQAAETEK